MSSKHVLVAAAVAALVVLGAAFASGSSPTRAGSDECTKTLAGGGDLSNFLATLAPGDVG